MLNIIMLGGMSECGKTHAAKFLSKTLFTHKKIIFFEKLVMRELDIDSHSNDPYKEMYDNSHEKIFELFILQIEKYCKSHDIKNIVLDSTTRLDMVEYFNDSKHNYLSIYIDTEFDKRVEREFAKLGVTPLEVVKKATLEKDLIKLSRNADKVKEKSLIITNNGTMADFETELYKVANNLIG